MTTSKRISSYSIIEKIQVSIIETTFNVTIIVFTDNEQKGIDELLQVTVGRNLDPETISM